jgi:HAD superfamily hydrolase (TIGR01450 family)
MDMDGVLVHEERAIPGADRFIAALTAAERPFLVLTNNSIYTRRDLAARLRASGLDVPEEAIWTSALATARFLEDQRPGGSAFVIGEAGLTTALHEAGYTLTERAPDYVVLGETRTYSFERITRAIRLIGTGARFIATNPDATGPAPDGPLPATGSVAALVPQRDRGALRDDRDDRRPDGHRRRLRPRGRPAHGARPLRRRDARRGRAVPVPAVAHRRIRRRPRRRGAIVERWR